MKNLFARLYWSIACFLLCSYVNKTLNELSKSFAIAGKFLTEKNNDSER